MQLTGSSICARIPADGEAEYAGGASFYSPCLMMHARLVQLAAPDPVSDIIKIDTLSEFVHSKPISLIKILPTSR